MKTKATTDAITGYVTRHTQKGAKTGISDLVIADAVCSCG